MKITYLALCSDSLPYSKHREAQQLTWADESTDTFWLVGNGPDPQKVLREGNSLVVGISEEFENILEKTILSFRWAIENNPSEFYIRTNTSTYISDSALRSTISNIGSIEHYAAGALGKTRDSDQFGLKGGIFIAGNMMIFSHKTAELLSKMDSLKFKGVPDDVAISMYFQKNGVTFSQVHRNDLTDYKGFRPGLQHRVKSWSDPKVTSARMIEVHQFYKTTGIERVKSSLNLTRNEILRYEIEFPVTNFRRLGMNTKNFLRNLYSLLYTIWFIIRKKSI
jgi:hypothetical protein